MKEKRVVPIIFVLFIIASCFIFFFRNEPTSTPDQSQGQIVTSDVQVKGLVLKYALIDTAYEMYQINVANRDVFSEATYESFGQDAHDHYLWMKDFYGKLEDSLKEDLNTIFSNIHAWHLMNLVTPLEDDADLDAILKKLKSDNFIKQQAGEAIEQFFVYFYEQGFKDYLAANAPLFQGYADTINGQLENKATNLIGFMEEASGIRFKKRYKPEFYFTMRPIGAMGFDYKDVKVSTIQRTVQDDYLLLSTPFHEFAHELFQTFTNKKSFKKVCEGLTEVKALEEPWMNEYATSYDWVGWCEENLVEGFSCYLNEKYYGHISTAGTYIYDLDFYHYLKETNFDPKNITLEEASINFYKKILSEQL